MSKRPAEQVLTATDLKILRLLYAHNGPVKMGEITSHLKKYHNRVKDRVQKLQGIFIQVSSQAHSKREKPYEIIEAERAFVGQLLTKFEFGRSR